MTWPTTDTVVTFPTGAVAAEGTVVGVADQPGGRVVLTDRSPFHPVDPGWPDQGPDRGWLDTSSGLLPLTDCVLTATDGSALYVGSDVPVRRGEPGWAFLVGHVIDPRSTPPAVGEPVGLRVDARYREQLSAGHTGCHAAAVALNEAVALHWRKPVPTDGLGHADFDQLALTSSRIRPDGAVDTYRLGKSLRKRGFDAERLLASLPRTADRINETLARWVAAGAPVRIEVTGPGLTDLRVWMCELPDGVQRIPCGGTHLGNLDQFDRIEVSFQAQDAELTMTTTVVRRAGVPT